MLKFTSRSSAKGMSLTPYPSMARMGFTLIEVLVSCAVLSLLVVLLASAFSGFASLTRSSSARLEVNNQVRAAFDRLAFDLAAAVRNSDAPIDFRKNSQVIGSSGSVNDSLTLLADARTTMSGSRLARVGYQVERSMEAASGLVSDNLVRCVEPFEWTDSVANIALIGSGEKQVLVTGVFRLELCFLKTDGTLVAIPPAQKEISAVICAVASLDETTLSKLTTAQLDQLALALPDAVAGRLPLSDWKLNDFTALPRPVVQNVRFHQRYFYLR